MKTENKICAVTFCARCDPNPLSPFFSKFLICDKKGKNAWYGTFKNFTREYREEAPCEYDTTKKAVWAAQKIAEKEGLKKIKLNLIVNKNWLAGKKVRGHYQDELGMMGEILISPSELRNKLEKLEKIANVSGVILNFLRVEEAKNCANSLIIKERDAKASTNLVQYTELD